LVGIAEVGWQALNSVRMNTTRNKFLIFRGLNFIRMEFDP
jgi:hypothetical protein